VAKPSIFSKDYQKRMRRRRTGFAVLIVAAVVVAAVAFITGKNYLSKNNQQQANNTSTSENAKDVNSATSTDKNTTEVKEAETPKEEGFEFKLADGTSLKAVYTTTGTVKKFQYVSPKEKNVYFSINPTGDKIVVFDSGAQSIMLIDTAGKIQDITNPAYTSSKGVVTEKENLLSSKSSYIWCSSPAFISDTKVAYISQLPWLNKTTKYVWTVDVATGKHTKISDTYSGEEITFGKIESKGLAMNIDGSAYYITANGSVVK
jgi:hypothetical protein